MLNVGNKKTEIIDMKHKELITWLVFLALIAIAIIPTILLFKYFDIKGMSVTIIGVIVGMLLMFLSNVIVNKLDK